MNLEILPDILRAYAIKANFPAKATVRYEDDDQWETKLFTVTAAQLWWKREESKRNEHEMMYDYTQTMTGIRALAEASLIVGEENLGHYDVCIMDLHRDQETTPEVLIYLEYTETQTLRLLTADGDVCVILHPKGAHILDPYWRKFASKAEKERGSESGVEAPWLWPASSYGTMEVHDEPVEMP